MTQTARKERLYVPGPHRIAVIEDPPEEFQRGVIIPHQSRLPTNRGRVLGIGADCTVPVNQGERIGYSPFSVSEIVLYDDAFCITDDQSVFYIEDPLARNGSPLRCNLDVDINLPARSFVWRCIWIQPGHCLIRTHSPKGFKHVPGAPISLPFNKRTIALERNEKHPKVWAHVLAMRREDSEECGAAVGDFVLFARHSETLIAHDDPRAGIGRLPVALVRCDKLEAVDTDHTIACAY